MIELAGVSYRYPHAAQDAVRDFSAAFGRGEIVALTGRNGSGKTTLTRLMVGLLRPARGQISIDGADISGLDLYDIGRKAGYVFENPARQLFCATVFEEVVFGLADLGLPQAEIQSRAETYLGRLNISHLCDQYPGRLSQGEKQSVMLAAILARDTAYIILDEPTGGLDVRTRHELGQTLRSLCRQHGRGIVVVSHERGFIEKYADREVVCGL